MINAESSCAGGARRLRRLSVLIPVFNEEHTLDTILARLLDVKLPLELEILAVDDGSSDGSWRVLQRLEELEPRLRALQHRRNLGKGAAVRTAIKRMTGDVAVVQDADLEYNPADLPALLEPLLAGEADAAFGTRFPRGGDWTSPWWHWVVNHTLTSATNTVAGLELTDMETCYKMVRADVLQRLSLRSRTFTIEPELTCRLAQAGARICEVPIGYAHRSWKEGKKIGPRDAWKAIWQLFWCGLVDRNWERPATRLPKDRDMPGGSAGAVTRQGAHAAGVAGSTDGLAVGANPSHCEPLCSPLPGISGERGRG